MSHRTSSRAACAIALCFALALLAAPLPAAAQRLIVSYSPAGFFTPPVTLSWNVATGRLEWSLLPGFSEGGFVFSADGRYLARNALVGGTSGLHVTDALTGHVTPFPIDFTPSRAHPRQLAFYGLTAIQTGIGRMAGTAARLDPGGLHQYDGCAAGTTMAVDLTVDGHRLLALCRSGDVVVMDAASGAVQRTVSSGTVDTVANFRANADGSRVLVTRDGTAPSAGVALVDTVSGGTLGTTVFPDPSPYPSASPCLSGQIVGVSPDRRTAAIWCSWFAFSSPPGGPSSFAVRTRLLDVDSLTWGIDLGINFRPTAVEFSPDGRTVFAHSVHPRGASSFQVIDTATGATLAAYSGMTFSLAAAFAPLAPALSAAVVGTRLDLTWSLPLHSPDAMRYVLEAGTAPGLTDVGTLALGPGQTLSIPVVPPGTYVVRVRAANATGVGAASNEIVITVP